MLDFFNSAGVKLKLLRIAAAHRIAFLAVSESSVMSAVPLLISRERNRR